jgi:hypothetical protein
MKSTRLPWLSLLFIAGIFTPTVEAQLYFKLQLMDNDTWGVYVKPHQNIAPSPNTITASGQVTIVTPNGFTWTNLVNVNGKWENNSTVAAPAENPTRKYYSFGLVAAEPLFPIQLAQGQETLLFTFDRNAAACPDSMQLIDCGTASVTDPFCPDYQDNTPGVNSVSTNPGNNLDVFDFGAGGLLYGFSGNYARSAWSCEDCDNDGIPNALEDTNGNGQYDPGTDASPFCLPTTPCSNTALSASVGTYGDPHICLGIPSDAAYLHLSIVGGTPPYEVVLSDGVSTMTIPDYYSGDSIYVRPSTSSTFSIVNVKDQEGCSVPAAELTGSAAITVQGDPVFGQTPANVLACSGQPAWLVASAYVLQGTFSFAWERSVDGATWSPVTMTGIYSHTNGAAVQSGTDTLKISNTAGLQGNYFRAVAVSSGCVPVTSPTALITAPSQLTVASHPVSSVACAGSPATFTAAFDVQDAGSAGYQWQFSQDGGATWSNLGNNANYSGINTSTLTIHNTVALNGILFRLKAGSSPCGESYTNGALLTVEGPVVIERNPAPQTVCYGQTAKFNGSAAPFSGSAGVISYQWQVSTDGVNFNDIPAIGPTVYSGATTDELEVFNVQGLGGARYRLGARTVGCGYVYSVPAELVVEGPISILEEPQTAVACPQQSVTFSAKALNVGQGAIAYRWQQSDDGGATWNDIANGNNSFLFAEGADSEVLTLTPAGNLQGVLVRLAAATSQCDQAFSQGATVDIQSPFSVAEHPKNATTCLGGAANFSVSVNNSNNLPLSYQWQTSLNGFDWLDLNDGADFAAVNTATLQIPDATEWGGYRFRCMVSSNGCEEFSGTARLTLDGPIAFNVQPQGVEVCASYFFEMTAGASIPSGAALQYQWQLSQDGGINWTNVYNNAQFSGATSATLRSNTANGLNGSQFRVIATSAVCQEVSEAARVSYLSAAECEGDGCLKMKLQYLAAEDKWGVFVKPSGSFNPSALAKTTFGQVTIVSPDGFSYADLSSVSGEWALENMIIAPPYNPGAQYVTFKLMSNSPAIVYKPGLETLLFTFKRDCNCPDYLYLYDHDPFVEAPPTTIQGTDGIAEQAKPFELCGFYALGAWYCGAPNTIIALNNNGTATMDNSAGTHTTGQQALFDLPVVTKPGQCKLSPNPAKNWLTVDFPTAMQQENTLVRILDMQGVSLQTYQPGATPALRIELGDLLPGAYLLTIESAGKMLQAERFIKQ